jgi:hypothetical protein
MIRSATLARVWLSFLTTMVKPTVCPGLPLGTVSLALVLHHSSQTTDSLSLFSQVKSLCASWEPKWADGPHHSWSAVIVTHLQVTWENLSVYNTSYTSILGSLQSNEEGVIVMKSMSQQRLWLSQQLQCYQHLPSSRTQDRFLSRHYFYASKTLGRKNILPYFYRGENWLSESNFTQLVCQGIDQEPHLLAPRPGHHGTLTLALKGSKTNA